MFQIDLETPTYSPVSQSTVETIRQRTRTLHAQLEARIDLVAALSSLDAYRQLLQRYRSFYEPFEWALSRQPAAVRNVIQYPQRSRLKLLLQDLGAIGHLPSALAPIALPDLGTLDQIFGTLYVVEGSSLGGQIIYRQIEQRLGLSSTSGSAFFYGDGDRTSHVWRDFLTKLQLQVSHSEAAADSAAATFQLFAQALVVPSASKGRECPAA